MGTGVAKQGDYDLAADSNKSGFYLKGCVIISIVSVLLMFLPWVTISVKGGSKGTYFLFQIKQFFTDIKAFTGIVEFDYSVIIFFIPILLFLLSLVSLFKFYYQVVTKKSSKNTFMAYKQYSVFLMVNGLLFILTELVMTYVARHEILVKKVPFGYNPVHITPVPFLMIILGAVGYFIFITAYYQEVLFSEGAEYFIMPKHEDKIPYMKRSTALLSWSVIVFVLAFVPMLIRAISVILSVILKKDSARTAMFRTVLAEETYKRYIGVDGLNLIMWLIPTAITLLSLHAAVRFLVNVIRRKNRINIATALKNSMAGVALANLFLVATGWLTQLIAVFVKPSTKALILANRLTVEEAISRKTILEEEAGAILTGQLTGMDKFAMGLSDLNAAYTIPVMAYVLLILGCIGYFYLSKSYCAELYFEKGEHPMPVPKKYNQVQ